MSSLDETNAFAALNQLILPNSISPTKMGSGGQLDEQVLKILQGLPLFNNMQNPMRIETTTTTEPLTNGIDEVEKPSPSNDSSRQTMSPESDEQNSDGIQKALTTSTKSSEGWYECFTTTSKAEFDALIYSLYVIEKDERKMDGWQYFECLNRLQNKCRFKIRTKKQDEFLIVEEKCAHNHGIEPVGQAGSHAGLPKTVREIVDKAFNENWSNDMRDERIGDEIRRLGLPKNPRLGRQIDNRVAYLRRVKNLNETKKIQDQVNATAIDPNALFTPQMLQMLMEQNGGSLVVEKDVVDKLVGEFGAQLQNNENVDVKPEVNHHDYAIPEAQQENMDTN
ncbi:unnamed protein product [Caenorhabditis bovis]|uniref:FLYWCH-type domain-containing protein n=1 Tax=Caenorhabditis bovis TaxID=2654633 RepID=A0A8S1F0K0_9PELO|nr:unnamed protein product [Caenorhabditis bovis]